MADYLFAEILGRSPSDVDLRAAKTALMPLRGHSGRLGWAVTVLLEGSERRVDYDEATTILLDTARGGDANNSHIDGRESASLISLRPKFSGGQLTFPGLED
jgi:hypothetical protein